VIDFKNIIQNIKWKKWLLVAALIPVILIVLFFTFRNIILHKLVAYKVESIRINKKVIVNYSEIDFDGISGIKLKQLSVKPIAQAELINSQEIYFHIKLLPLLIGNIRIDDLEINETKINIVKKDSINNYSFLIRKKRKQNSDTLNTNQLNIAETADHLLDNVFDNIPNLIAINNTTISASLDSAQVNWQIPTIHLDNGHLQSTAKITENALTVNWVVDAQINKSDRRLKFKLYHDKNHNASLPFLVSKFNLKCAFDTLSMSINEADFEDDKFYISGNASINNLVANHWRISPSDVTIKNASLEYKLFFAEAGLGIDSSTICMLNDIKIKPYIAYHTRPSKTFALDIKIPKCDGNYFFNSLPNGLFSSLEGIKTKGELGYDLHFYLDSKQPDSLQFSSSFLTDKFSIVNYGQANLSKMNDEFLYTAYEKDFPVATFPVGLSNPDFTPLSEVSPYLKNSILVSEDGDFFWHKGFNENAFRKSIATNFKERKFKRGGSTISMQLVKNVFLTRKKTIARKLEEALIVWLIENNRITSKDRMFEVYLNVIEWGPGVYGVGEASRYYFNKHANQLTLGESIFLAMIIPRPKYFYWHFDDAGKLKKGAEGYFKLVAGKLLRREIISEEEKDNIKAEIDLVGIAKEKLKIKADTLVSDSLLLLNEIE